MAARFGIVGLSVLSCMWLWGLNVARPDDDPSNDEARKTAERYVLVLERNPRKGTALDKVLEFHTERGTLDEFLQQQRAKAQAAGESQPLEAGRAWMVVGLAEDARAETELAVEAFAHAEKLLGDAAAKNGAAASKTSASLMSAPLASFYLGQSLATLSHYPEAAEALERAIARKPAPTDLLDVFQTLGRVQQRLQSGDKVVEVWSRLEKLVPNDPRVPELIARTLLDDGHLDAALPRFEKLSAAAADPYRRSELELELIDIRLKLGQTERALAESDKLLSTLKPDHWLFRETRQRVEQSFLNRDDAVGLVKHYEERLAKQLDDFDAVVRLSRALVLQGNSPEARSKLEAAIKLAPNSADLRIELIGLLEQDQRFADVVAQYEQLDRIEPNHPDHVRDWGFAVLKLKSQESDAKDQKSEDDGERERRLAKRAATIWRKLVEAKPDDAVVVAQVAGLLWQTGLLPDAEELLRRAIELAPDTLSHREELGEVLDAQKKKDESLAAWRSMAEEPRRTAANLATLAEVLGRFGYRDESLKAIDDACELDPKGLELRFQQIDLRKQWRQHEAARAAIAEAYRLADAPETFDRVVQREVDVLSQAELLMTAIEELRAELPRLAASTSVKEFLGPAAQWFRLARLLEAAAQPKEATLAAQKAAELAPKIGFFLQTAARLLAQDSQWQPAIELHQQLIASDRRFRVDSLRAIAELEMKLGRKDRALKAARDLLAATPGAPDHADFAADVFLRFGLSNEALHVLRRTSRQNPADKRLALRLTEQLLAGNHITEARDVLWRAFEQSSKLEDRIEVVRKLSELAAFPGEFDKLVQRLQRLRQEPKLARDATLCLVQVHELSGDVEKARRELERLLPQSPRDTELLKRLSLLCEAAGDIEAAIVHQGRLVTLTAGASSKGADTSNADDSQADSLHHEERLIALLRKAGRADEAAQLAASRLESERDPARLLREIDRLLAEGQTELALRVIRRQLDNDSTNWEFVFREALALKRSNQQQESVQRFKSLLELPNSDDDLSVLPTPGLSFSKTNQLASRIDRLRTRLELASLLRTTGRRESTTPALPPSMARPASSPSRLILLLQSPGDFGQARMIALQEVTRGGTADFSLQREPLRQLWDDAYLEWILRRANRLDAISLDLLRLGKDDPVCEWAAIHSRFREQNSGAWSQLVGRGPLEKDHVDTLLAAYRHLRTLRNELPWDAALPNIVGGELARANRPEDVRWLLSDIEEHESNIEGHAWLLSRLIGNDDLDGVLRVFPKLVAVNEEARRAGQASVLAPEQLISEFLGFAARRAEFGDTLQQRAEKGPRPSQDALRILDAVFTEFSKLNPAATGTVAGPQWTYWKQNRPWATYVPFPPQDGSAESAAMHMLYQVQSLAVEQRWSEELTRHVARLAERASPNSRLQLFARLGVACLQVWNDQTAATLEGLRGMFDEFRQRQSWQASIASLHRRHDQAQIALELFDRIETTDGELVKLIELQALELASKLKNTERAREAAEKLFGVKLEPTQELALAKQLTELGLKEQAQALLARAPQRYSNDVGVLEQVMEQHANQKNLDEACAVAEQIVRRTQTLANAKMQSGGAVTFGQASARVGAVSEHARAKALALLASAGRLQSLIEQTEQQFENSPTSLRIVTQLTELYAAAARHDKQVTLLAKLTQTNATDPAFRLYVARSLAAVGDAKNAVTHYLFVLEKSANVTPQILFEAENLIQETGSAEDLARIVLNSKLAANDFQRIELFGRLVQKLEGPPIRARLIIELFRKAFRDSPDFRPQLSARLLAVQDSVWQQEEMWEVARDFVLPAADRQAVSTWHGVDVTRLHNGSNIDSLMFKLIELAAREKKLDELAQNVSESLKKHAGWLGGRLMLGMIRLKQGDASATRTEIEHVLRLSLGDKATVNTAPAASTSGKSPESLKTASPAAEKDDLARSRKALSEAVRVGSVPGLLSLSVGYKLAGRRELTDLAMRFYEPTLAQPMSVETRRIVLDHCRVYGDRPEFQQMATDVLLSLVPNDDAEQDAQSLAHWIGEVSTIAKELNQPYIAARLAATLRARVLRSWLDAKNPDVANASAATNDTSWLKQIEERFAQAAVAIKPDMLPTIFRLAIREQSRRGSARPRLDLLPHVAGESVAEMQLHSPILVNLKAASADDKLWRQVSDALAQLKEQCPDDDSAALVLAFATLIHADQDAGQTEIVEQLQALIARLTRDRPGQSDSPPEQLARRETTLMLWLLARECLGHDGLHDVGLELTRVATTAAEQHRDARFLWALLREQGQFALARGDKPEAEKLWTSLVREALRPRAANAWVPMTVNGMLVGDGDWPHARLTRARDLARLTLDAGFASLSLAAFRDVVTTTPTRLEMGMLFDNGQQRLSGGRLTLHSKSHFVALVANSVVTTWDDLEPRWREKSVAPEAIFATLSECVLPAERRGEINVFALPVERDSSPLAARHSPLATPKEFVWPQSLGQRLVQLAVPESRVDDLRQRLSSRETAKDNEFALRLLWLQLGLATRDDKLIEEQFAALERHAAWPEAWPWLAHEGQVTAQIIRLLSQRTTDADRTSKLFAALQAAQPKEVARSEFPASDLRRWLTKHHLRNGDSDKAGDTLAAHLRHMEGVWSTAGAMDGQHLRRLELLDMAFEYATAGLAKEALDLLGQAADARWPDKFADENPGRVLVQLEIALKDKSADERFLLWRNWSLPDSASGSARSQMRLLTGAIEVTDIQKTSPDASVKSLRVISSAQLLIDAARAANRLDELRTFVATAGIKRFDARANVLLALIHLADKDVAAAEPLLQQIVKSGESPETKPGSALRTQVWDDALLAEACRPVASLREIETALTQRALAGARELKDETLLRWLNANTKP